MDQEDILQTEDNQLFDEQEIKKEIKSRREQRLKKRHRKFLILLIAEVTLVVLVIGFAALFFYVKSKTYDKMNTSDVIYTPDDIKSNDDIDDTVKIAAEKYTTIMLYGVDARNNKDLIKYANADTDIIVVIDNDTYEVKLVSVLRDTFMSMTTGKYRKLTDIYSGWGVKESLESVNRNFDLQIKNYVSVNWKALADAISMMGGLDIDLTTGEIKNMNSLLPSVMDATGLKSYPITGTSGQYHLDGVMSVCYARVRHGGDNEHDIGRASRQRIVINKMLEKAKTMSINQLTDICEKVFPGIATNLSFADIIGMVMNVMKYNITQQTLFPFHYSNQNDLRTAYVYCKPLTDNVIELHEFLYGKSSYKPSGTVKNISAYIDNYRREHP